MSHVSRAQLVTASATVIAHRIRQAAARSSGPYLIAIDGYSGAGKSTLTAKLARLLSEVRVVQLDDYMHSDKIAHNTADKEAFDRQRLIAEVLEPLQGELSPTIVILEGVTSSHPELDKYLDLRIWVRLPRLKALARAEDRDQLLTNFDQTIWEDWSASDRLYLDKYRPDLRADIMYDNNLKQICTSVGISHATRWLFAQR